MDRRLYLGQAGGTHVANEHEGMSDPGQAGLAAASNDAAQVIAQNDSTVRRLLRRFGVAPSDLADAHQEVNLVVWRRLGDFENRSSITTWLFTICRRVAKDQRRRAYRHHECASEIHDAASPAPSQQHVVEVRERLACVEHAYRELSAEKQDALVSLGIDGDAVACVANRQRCPEKTVFSRLYAAREHLHRALRGSGLAALAPAGGARTPWRALRCALERHAARFAMTASCAVSLAVFGVPPEPARLLLAPIAATAVAQPRRVSFSGVGTSRRSHRLNAKSKSVLRAAPSDTAPRPESAMASMEFSVLEVPTPGSTLAMVQVDLLEFEVAFATAHAVVTAAPAGIPDAPTPGR
jgi:RNA polymerase sigma-70 factor (ECF subfamily)